ncbi:hypothetical protein FACS1894211_13820 [Clostridia bacterium]|nr:hypothetical protein FACS1894211_13820 [Clostridia bacterium]
MERNVKKVLLLLILTVLLLPSAVLLASADSPVKNVSLYSRPEKVEYLKDGALDLSGAKLLVVYGDGTSQVDITPAMLGAYSLAETGVKTIEVTYEGFTVSFQIEVVENYVTELTVKTKPAKLDYKTGDVLSLDGGVLSAVWFDGSVTDVSMTASGVTVSAYNDAVSGRQLVTVVFAGGTTSYSIDVTATTGGNPNPGGCGGCNRSSAAEYIAVLGALAALSFGLFIRRKV